MRLFDATLACPEAHGRGSSWLCAFTRLQALIREVASNGRLLTSLSQPPSWRCITIGWHEYRVPF